MPEPTFTPELWVDFEGGTNWNTAAVHSSERHVAEYAKLIAEYEAEHNLTLAEEPTGSITEKINSLITAAEAAGIKTKITAAEKNVKLSLSNTIESVTEYTFEASDLGKTVEWNGVGKCTFKIPHCSGEAPFPIGAVLLGCQIGSGKIKVEGAASVVVHEPSGLESETSGEWSTFAARQRAANVWVLSGDLA